MTTQSDPGRYFRFSPSRASRSFRVSQPLRANGMSFAVSAQFSPKRVRS